MTTKEFLEQYAAFVMDSGLSKFSADQYKSYLKNVGKKLVMVANHLDMIAATENAALQAVYVEEMNIAITTAMNDAGCTLNKKKLSDYRCAIAVLHAFVEDLAWDKGTGAVAKAAICGVSEYERKDIRRIFSSRVKTQDRLSYPYGVFVARILCKIANIYKMKLFDKMVNNTKFLIAADPNKFIRLKDISKLTIATDGLVYIESKGKIYPVYTEVVKAGASKGYEKVKVAGVRELSLDHDRPLYYALQDALMNMPEYKKLSDAVKEYQKTYKGKTASDLSKDYYNTEYSAEKLGICEKGMLDEVGKFIDSTQLTVMLSSYNSSKSKNDP